MQALAHVEAPCLSPLSASLPCLTLVTLLAPFPGPPPLAPLLHSNRSWALPAHPLPFYPRSRPVSTMSYSAPHGSTCWVSESAAVFPVPPVNTCAQEPSCAASVSPPPPLKGLRWCPPPAQRPPLAPPCLAPRFPSRASLPLQPSFQRPDPHCADL